MTAILRAAEAVALAAVTIAAAAVTRQYQTGAQQLTVALLGTCAILALAAAVGAVCGAVYRLVAGTPQRPAEVYTPTRAPLWPSSTDPDPVTTARDARIIDAYIDRVAAERSEERRARHAAWTPATLPLPALDDTAVMAAVGGER
jgi:hypothetical protein